MPTRTSVALGGLLYSLAGTACTSAPPAQSPENTPRTGLVAQPCPELALDGGPLDSTNARAFVEVVEVSTPDLPNPITNFLEDHAVTIRSSANLVAFPDVETSSPWAQCVDVSCSETRRSVLVTAHLPERGTDPLDLQLRVQEAPPEATAAEGTAAEPRVLLSTRLRPLQQEPVIVPASPELGPGSLIVTAYLLRRSDDLQRMLTCKEQQKEREKQLH